MIIDLEDALSNARFVKDLTADIGIDTVKVTGNEYRIAEKDPVEVSIRNIGRSKVNITAETSVVLEVPCDRCLKDTPVPIKISCDMEYDALDKSDKPDILSFIHDTEFDVDELVRTEIVTDFPVKVLCNEDCKGLCPVCGKDLNEGECGCDRSFIDPRMAKIQELFNEFKEV